VPSDLLRRRPDVLAAERRLAAAGEGVSVALVSYLPRLTLSGSGGASALGGSELFNANSRFWSIGPTLFVPVFQGNRIKSDRARAEAGFREALAAYRSVLLGAIRDTETALQSGRNLERALASQGRAAAAARQAAELSEARRAGGLVSLFEVIDSDRSALDQDRLLAQTLRDRQLATVNLIQALGGGWEK
jgi:multidrug efflux system outer membrane protein